MLPLLLLTHIIKGDRVKRNRPRQPKPTQDPCHPLGAEPDHEDKEVVEVQISGLQHQTQTTTNANTKPKAPRLLFILEPKWPRMRETTS